MTELRFKPGAIGTVPDGSITEAKLAAGAVTHPKLADDAVESDKIKAGEVKEENIGDNQVTLGKVAEDIFVVCDATGGDVKKVLSAGYDGVTQEIVLQVAD